MITTEQQLYREAASKAFPSFFWLNLLNSPMLEPAQTCIIYTKIPVFILLILQTKKKILKEWKYTDEKKNSSNFKYKCQRNWEGCGWKRETRNKYILKIKKKEK